MARRRVAVVGSGVAGLTAAYLLRRGTEVTLFEADDRLGGRGPGGLFPTLGNATNPRYLRLLGEVVRFHRRARALLDAQDLPDADQTLAQFVRRGRFSRYFCTHFLTPLVSAVWSCPPQLAGQYPARYLFAFLRNHGMLTVTGSPRWRTVVGSSASYVHRAVKALSAVHTNTPVRSLARDGDGQSHRFDAEGLTEGLSRMWQASTATNSARRHRRLPPWAAAVSLARLGALGPRPAPPTVQAHQCGHVHSLTRDRAVIAHHYDLSNKFYALILDESMAYSCAYYRHDGMSLAQAQRAELDLICTKLGLRSGQRLVDVSFAASAGTGDTVRRWLILAMTLIWGLRLAGHVARRNHGTGEDPRYTARLDGHGRWFPLVAVYLPQGALAFLVPMPIQVAVFQQDPLTPLAWFGAGLWLLGMVFETVGDAQLARFKADPNRGGVLDTGLWRYTRHPNYFGDACVWAGIFLVTAEHWPGALTAVSPAVMIYLLAFDSGKALLERAMADRPGYRDYMRRTSGFLPLPPRRS